MNEKLSPEGEALEAAVLRNADAESLTRSRPWGRLVAFIEDQTTQRMNHIMLTPLTDVAQMAEQNFMRGECAGLNLLKKFVEDELKVGREAVELYRQALSEAAGEE